MGFATGADKMLPQSARAKPGADDRPAGRRPPVLWGALGLWGVLGAGAVGVLAWLVVDLGGPAQMARALYSAQGPASEWAALRQDIKSLAADRARFEPVRPDQSEEVRTLKRRVAMLEGMLTGDTGNVAMAANPPIGPPRTTASIPRQKPVVPIAERFAPLKDKVDLPRRSIDRATRPPTHTNTQTAPTKMALAPNSARRSRLAPSIVYGLDLGAYESIEVLKRRWNLVERRHQDILGDLAPRRITEFSADGRIAHRLIAAPLDDAMEVARRCAALQGRSVPCRQTLGAGEPL